MKKIIHLIFVCLSFFLMQYVYAGTTDSPVGYWKTLDDVSGKPKSILQIWETPNKTMYGRIVKIWPDPGKDENEVCTACEGSRHNKRILGMVIMENLSQSKDNPNEWRGGSILDPHNGKTYHFYIQLADNGQKLNARGYIGMPLFSRSQTWIRVSGLDG